MTVDLDTNTLVLITAGLFGGTGLLGGIAALRRAPADTGKVIAEAAQGAVLVQQAAIQRLEAELHETQAELNKARQELASAINHSKVLKIQIDELAAKVAQLEQERSAGLEGRVTGLESRERGA